MVRRCLAFSLFLGCVAFPAAAQQPESKSLANLKRDIFFLASDECEGRGPGTKGIDLAAEYIAKQFADAGLQPGGVKDSYYQPFTIGGFPALGKPNSAIFDGPDKSIPLDQGKQFEVMGLSGKGKIDAPLVFVGFGLQAKNQKYDEYEGLDVKGKIVVMLRHTPRWSNKEKPFGGNERDMLASLERKVATAEANKAAGVIVVNDASEIVTGDMLPPFSYLSTASSSRIPCIQVKREAIEPVIKSGLGISLGDLEKGIDDDLKPRSAPIKGWSAKIETTVARTTLGVKNVIGVVEGKGPLAKEILVVGSHYDHLGYGGSGSLAKSKDKAIHHGADDNASGTTSMMELARRFAAMKDRQGRKIVFMAFSAEERGLLGSQHYASKEPLFPLADTVAMVNLDMVGKLRPDGTTKKDKLIVQGVGTSKSFEPLIEKLNTADFTLSKVASGFGPSDHNSFYSKRIPVLFFWTGTHPDYHKPSDTADRINLEGMKKIVDYVETVVAELANGKDRPQYVEQKAPPKTGAPKGPRLGIMPDYEADKQGVVVGGVTDGSVAAAAGLKAGDRIVEIAGKNVSNIETYMVIMSQQKLGSDIEIGLIRGDKKLTVKATLK